MGLCSLPVCGHSIHVCYEFRDLQRWARGFWRVADPRISLASFASMTVAAAAAWADGARMADGFGRIVLAIFALEWAKNASGEIVDFHSGADTRVSPEDRSPFSGGKRVLIDGLLTPSEVAVIAAAGYLLFAVLGLEIVLRRDPVALPLGIAGAILAFFYHAPPLQLAYRGLGELAVFVAYGPLLMNGTYRVLSGKWSEEVAWLSLTYGLLVAAFLWINEFPDAAADEAAGKRTWVVRLGKARAAEVFAVIVGAAWLLFACALLLVLPWTEVLALAGVVPSVQAIRSLLRSWNSTRQLIPAQARTLAAFVLFAVGASLGMVIARSLAPAVPH